MNGTPRLRSAFPSTPQSGQKFPAQNVSTSGGRGGALPLPTMSSLSNQRKGPNAPLIPFDIVDAPSQRLYVSAFYLGLTAWRLYDYFHLVSNQTDSLWLFMKWVAIDGVFLYGLPGLNIPWLEWSSSTMTMLFLVHALLDGILMFRIPVCTPAPAAFGLWRKLTILIDPTGGVAWGIDEDCVRQRDCGLGEECQTGVHYS